jgi:hypothetical protein
MVQAEIDHLNKAMKLSLQQTAAQHSFEPKSQQKRSASSDVGAGGKFVRLQSDNFDIIINILIGIRRSLSNLVEIPGKALDKHEF